MGEHPFNPNHFHDNDECWECGAPEAATIHQDPAFLNREALLAEFDSVATKFCLNEPETLRHDNYWRGYAAAFHDLRRRVERAPS